MTRIAMDDAQSQEIGRLAMDMENLPCAGTILAETVMADGPKVRAA